MAFVGSVSIPCSTLSTTRVSFKTSHVYHGSFLKRSRSQITKRHVTNVRHSSPIRMEGNPPINAPSGVLLLASSVLAIASVGSIFELTGGHPTYGPTFTTGVLIFSFPGFLFLFYSAIRKGQQEALDDP